MKKKEEVFRDFTLCELSHLNLLEVFGRKEGKFHPRETAEETVRERLEFGKKIIDQETRPGDMVMLECPDKFTLEDFRETYKNTDFAGLEKHWDKILKDFYNFYHYLAKYAESKGRKVVSLEPGVTKPGSRLRKAFVQLPESSGKHARATYLITHRRNISMERKIQAKKPSLVITASGHTLYLERMHPKKVIYHQPVSEMQRTTYRLSTIRILQDYEAAKKAKKKPKHKHKKPK